MSWPWPSNLHIEDEGKLNVNRFDRFRDSFFIYQLFSFFNSFREANRFFTIGIILYVFVIGTFSKTSSYFLKQEIDENQFLSSEN